MLVPCQHFATDGPKQTNTYYYTNFFCKSKFKKVHVNKNRLGNNFSNNEATVMTVTATHFEQLIPTGPIYMHCKLSLTQRFLPPAGCEGTLPAVWLTNRAEFGSEP